MIQIPNFIKNFVMFSIVPTVIAGAWVLLSGQTVLGGDVGEYAHIQPSAEIESQVKTNKLPVNYKYYYTGRDDIPYAVIGINPEYTVEAKFWYEIKTQDEVIYKINHLMPIVQATDITYGKIVDAEGNQAGVWFSEYSSGVVRFETGNRLTVFSPYQPGDDI
jgi:hypothetical protein